MGIGTRGVGMRWQWGNQSGGSNRFADKSAYSCTMTIVQVFVSSS